MLCQKNKFSLPADIRYLNGAYMSPQLKSVEEVGIKALKLKNQPHLLPAEQFFNPVKELKQTYAKLIGVSDFERIALVPSVSYGLAGITQNVVLKPSQKIILMQDQFPSNVYPWQRMAEKYGAKIQTISPPEGFQNRGKIWNERILEAIDYSTAIVAMAHCHWANGTKFDLKAIREKTKQHGALLIIDGTQSVGALPFYVPEFEPDALVCAGYKWLLGPYSLGLAYYSSRFDDGMPIEEGWINRLNSDDFARLVDYQPRYREKAGRFSMGESSNFILVPTLTAAIEQLLDWKPENIQAYCEKISEKTLENLRDMDIKIEDPDFRGKHLFGVPLTDDFDLDKLKKQFAEEKIYVSYRGDSIRISPNVYNEEKDFEKLLTCFKKAKKKKLIGIQ